MVWAILALVAAVVYGSTIIAQQIQYSYKCIVLSQKFREIEAMIRVQQLEEKEQNESAKETGDSVHPKP